MQQFLRKSIAVIVVATALGGVTACGGEAPNEPSAATSPAETASDQSAPSQAAAADPLQVDREAIQPLAATDLDRDLLQPLDTSDAAKFTQAIRRNLQTVKQGELFIGDSGEAVGTIYHVQVNGTRTVTDVFGGSEADVLQLILDDSTQTTYALATTAQALSVVGLTPDLAKSVGLDPKAFVGTWLALPDEERPGLPNFLEDALSATEKYQQVKLALVDGTPTYIATTQDGVEVHLTGSPALPVYQDQRGAAEQPGQYIYLWNQDAQVIEAPPKRETIPFPLG